MFFACMPTANAEVTTYKVYNIPDMTLASRISTSTQTTRLSINGPKRNGVTVAIPSMSGAVFEIRQGTKIEHIYASRVTVNTTTKLATLTGTIIRDNCWNNADEYVGCLGGQTFTPGATVRLVPDKGLFNRSLYNDRAITTRGSGAIVCGSTSQPCFINRGWTTAQIAAFSYGLSSGMYPDVFNSTTGVKQYWNGTTWINYGSGSIVNASTTVAGKVLLGTIAQQISKASTDVNGTPYVVQTQHLTSSGSIHSNNSYQYGRIPTLNSSGAVPSTLGGLGTTKINSGALLIGAGSGAVKSNLIPLRTNSGTVVTSSGTGGFVLRNPQVTAKTVFASSVDSTATGTSMATPFYYDTYTYTIPAGDLVNGVCYKIEGYSKFVTAAGYVTTAYMQVGTRDIAVGALTVTGAGTEYKTYEGQICGTAAAGASVTVRTIFESFSDDNDAADIDFFVRDEVSMATNGTLRIRFGGLIGTSNAGNSSTMQQMVIQKVSSTPFQ